MEIQGKLNFLNNNILLITILVLSGILLLAIMISMMKIYQKAGKPAISVIIPIWGQIVLFEITGIAWWYVFIPFVNIVMMIKAYIILAKKFGKSSAFAIGMIFLPMIFFPLLSFYDYESSENKSAANEVIYNPFNQESVDPVATEVSVTPVTPVAPIMNIEPVAAEIPVVETPVVNAEPIIENIPVMESVANVEPVVNPTIQDIEVALNINQEPSQIAFNSTPVQEVVKNTEIVEELNVTEDNIELPEVAAKTCPACGVGLAENINFCTSCGTKI